MTTRVKLDAEQRAEASALIEYVLDDPESYAYELVALRTDNAALRDQLAAVQQRIVKDLRQRAIYWDDQIPDKLKWDFRAEISAAFDVFAQELADRLDPPAKESQS